MTKIDPSSENQKISSAKVSVKDPVNKSSAVREFPFWKAAMLSLVAIALFFGFLEGVLAIVGVRPTLLDKDPFVGFVANVPLFVPEIDRDGRQILTTAANKLSNFNHQQFYKKKPAGAYRIFCLGGSTTYGRPYNDTTSFAGWLRELLPRADPSRRWEVINGGGVSYASYRVARLMKELALYEPDLFIIYSGHNEFLEQRSYGALRDAPGVVKSTAALLARTRTWTAMSLLMRRMNISSSPKPDQRFRLTREVDTQLEKYGPDIYERDDNLRDKILMHYRLSLERMVDIAESVNANVIFVTPASNLKDFSPFKSQHTDGLGESDRLRVENLLANGMELMRESRWSEALEVLDEGVVVDPRFAELHYRRAKALFSLGQHEEAKAAFRRARDEDVCPLRILSPMQETVAEVSRETGLPLVDFVGLLEQRLSAEQGHRILGEEYFLDHVHPTIEVNRMLALWLIEAMSERGILQPVDTWGEQAIAEVSSQIEARLDPEARTLSLVNLAKVLTWAGKIEDASPLASQALASGTEDPWIIQEAASILAMHYGLKGDTREEQKYFRMALNVDPGSPDVHYKIGLRSIYRQNPELEAAAAHIFFAAVFWSGQHRYLIHQHLGQIMAERGRYAAAYSELREARRLNPQDKETEFLLSRLVERLGPEAQNIGQPKVALQRYPSGALFIIAQMKPNATGRHIPDGIYTEWYEGGELKRFVDYAGGVVHGVDMTWDPEGKVISRVFYEHGTRK
jgi:tetratricopeptide (TPR) repeat protein